MYEIGIEPYVFFEIRLHRVTVVSVQTLVCSYPYETPAVLHDGCDTIIGQSAVLGGYMGEVIGTGCSMVQYQCCKKTYQMLFHDDDYYIDTMRRMQIYENI